MGVVEHEAHWKFHEVFCEGIRNRGQLPSFRQSRADSAFTCSVEKEPRKEHARYCANEVHIDGQVEYKRRSNAHKGDLLPIVIPVCRYPQKT